MKKIIALITATLSLAMVLSINTVMAFDEDPDYDLRCSTVSALGLEATNLASPNAQVVGGVDIAYAEQGTTLDDLLLNIPIGFVITTDFDNLLRTGGSIKIYKGGATEENLLYAADIVIRGDCSGDGIVDITDIVTARDILVNHYSGESSSIETAFYWGNINKCHAMDINGDRNYDIVDVVIMRSRIINGEK